MSKKFLRGGIFKHGFLEPLGINFEGLDDLFLRSELFIQIHFGVVCQKDQKSGNHGRNFDLKTDCKQSLWFISA